MSEVYIDLPELHPNQQAIYDAPERFKIALCGRQFGKSTMCIQECIYTLLGLRNPNEAGKPENIFYITPQLSLARKFYADILNILEPAGLVEHKNGSDLIIRLKGSYIRIYGADNYNGLRGNNDFSLAIVDEAAFMDLEGLWNKVLMPILGRKKGRAYIISTPNSTNFFYKLWVKASEGLKNWKAFKYTSYESYYPAEELDDIKAVTPKVDFEQEYLCIVTSNKSNPWKHEDIQKNIIPKLSTDPVVVYGIDISNGQNDYSVCIGLTKKGEMGYMDKWQIQNNYTEQVNRIAALPKNVCKVIDVTGAGVAVGEPLINKGHYVVDYLFNIKTKPALIYDYIQAVENGNISYIQSVADEMTIYEKVFNETTGAVKFGNQVGVNNHDDEVTAAALAWHGLKEYVGYGGSSWKGLATA